MFSHDSYILHTILFSYCKEIRTFVIITHRLWYVIDELTGAGLYHRNFSKEDMYIGENFSISNNVGLLDYLYLGVKLEFIPVLFLSV